MIGVHWSPQSLKTLPLPHLIQYLDSGGVFHPFLSTISLLHHSPVVDQSHRVSYLLSSWGFDVLWCLIQYYGLSISQAAHLQQTSLLHSSHLTKRQILLLQNHEFSSLIIGFSSFCCLFHTCTSPGPVVYWSFYIWPIHQSPFVTPFHFQLIFTWFVVSKHSNECCVITWSSLLLFNSYGKIVVLFFLKNSVHLHLEVRAVAENPTTGIKCFYLISYLFLNDCQHWPIILLQLTFSLTICLFQVFSRLLKPVTLVFTHLSSLISSFIEKIPTIFWEFPHFLHVKHKTPLASVISPFSSFLLHEGTVPQTPFSFFGWAMWFSKF